MQRAQTGGDTISCSDNSRSVRKKHSPADCTGLEWLCYASDGPDVRKTPRNCELNEVQSPDTSFPFDLRVDSGVWSTLP